MVSTSTTATTECQAQSHIGTLKLRADADAEPEYVVQLRERGYAIVRNAISEGKAAEYVDRAQAWLEGFGKGYKRDDPSTFKASALPPNNRGGMYNNYAAGHEDWVWDVRTEPGVIAAFEKIWGTDKLLTSFDGVVLSIPLAAEERDAHDSPWPHCDQSATRRFFHCIQGIQNLLPNGPDDGGLMVLDGSYQLYKQFFDEHEDDAPEGGWPTRDFHMFTTEQQKWFEDKGCTWKHMDAGPGDLILWDSRTIHYGAIPKGGKPRFATYVCYKDASLISDEKLALKKEAFETSRNTSHDPTTFGVVPLNDERAAIRRWPAKKAVLSERQKQYAGLTPYE